jgi:hypothetical protein
MPYMAFWQGFWGTVLKKRELTHMVTVTRVFNYRERARQGGLRGWQNFSGVPCRRRPAKKTITLARIKAIA